MSLKRFFRFLVVTLLLAWIQAMIGSTVVYAETSLTVGVIDLQPAPLAEARWEPLSSYLEQYFYQQGRSVRVKIKAMDFSIAQLALQQRDLDFIITNPSIYVSVKQPLNLGQPLASVVSRYHDQFLYQYAGAVLTRADRSDIQTLADVVGKRIVASDADAFSGYQMQAYELLQLDIHLDIRDRHLQFVGHETSKIIDALKNGSADVAFMRAGVLERMQQSGEIEPGLFKVLPAPASESFVFQVSTRLYPEWPVIALNHVGQEMAAQFAAALLTLPRDSVTARAIGIGGFATPASYDSVYQVARALKRPPFDQQPEISWSDIWDSYRTTLLVMGLFSLLILLLVLALWHRNRRLLQAQLSVAQTKQELEHERIHLRTLINTLPDLVWLKDLNGVYLACNPLFEHFMARPESQIVGKTDRELTDAKLAEWLVDADQRAIESNLPYSSVMTLEFKDLDYSGLFEIVTTPTHDQHGHLMGVLGIARDVTESRQQQEALIESQRRYRILFDESLDAVTVTEDGRFVDANPAALRLFGFRTVEDFRRYSPMSLSPDFQPDGRSSFEKSTELLNKAVDGGVEPFEWEYRRLDGSRFLVEIQLTSTRYQGRMLSWGLLRDLTPRLAAEQTLRKESRLRKQLIESIPGAFYLIDRFGRYLAWNTNLEKITQRNADEIRQLDLLELFDERDRSRINQELVRVFNTGSSSTEADIIAKDGSRTPFFLSGLRIEVDGQPCVIGIGIDITERKLIENQLNEERRRLQDILDATQAGTWEWYVPEDHYVFNERWAQNLGYSRDEIEPVFNREYWTQIIHPDDRALATELLEAHLANRSDYYECEVRMRHREGHWVWFAAHGRVIRRTSDGLALVMSGSYLDITKRKQAEEELRLSEQRFRSMAENTSDWLWQSDADGRFFYSNQAASQIFGYSSEDWSKLKRADLMHPDDLRAFETIQHESIAKLSGWRNQVWRWLTRSGDYVSLESNSAPILDASGQLVGFQGVDRDISARIAAETALRESEFFLKQSQLIGNLGGWRADPQSDFAKWTEGVYAIVGVAAEYQPTYSGWLAFFSDASRSEVRSHIESALQNGESFKLELQLIDAHQQLKWVELRGFPHYEADVIDYLVGTIQDITEHKRIVADLQKLWLAVEQSPNSILITNLNAEIEYINTRFSEITGYSREETLGKNPRMLQTEQTPKAVFDSLWQALQEGRSWEGEFCNRRKDGELYTEYAYISPVRQPDGKITHYLAIQEDITEKKRLADELEKHRHHLEALVASRTQELELARQAAESANRSKSVFLANMSHEIRTPMNAIIGMTHLLQRDLRDNKQIERLDKITVSAKHLLSIINDILDLSKIEANHMHIEEVQFSVTTTIDHVISMMKERSEAKGIPIQVEVAPEFSGVFLQGDPLRIGQILINYLSNALKFTDSGVIGLKVYCTGQDAQSMTLRFEVTDTGIGLTEEQQVRVFEAFEQGQASTTRKYGGTGLGLTICRHLAHLMGGEVGVVSAVGQGSSFWLCLKLQRSQQAVERPASMPVRQNFRLGASLLVVDDNEINQEVARQLLESVGLKADIANNGREAVDKVSRGRYDMILMDMQMPVMDGIEATSVIRTLPDYTDSPIIAMTANVFEEDRQQCLNVGMNDFLAKPFDPKSLFSILARWLPDDREVPPDLVVKANRTAASEFVSSLLDVQLGLRNFSQHDDNYHRILQRFLALHADDAGKVSADLLAHDLESARHKLHSLKGIVGTLGLMPLFDAIDRVDADLKKRAPDLNIDQQLNSLSDLLSASCAEIERYLEYAQRAKPTSLIGLENLRTQVALLERQLATDTLSASDTWRELKPSLSQIIGSNRTILVDQKMENYDLPQALIYLHALLDEFAVLRMPDAVGNQDS